MRKTRPRSISTPQAKPLKLGFAALALIAVACDQGGAAPPTVEFGQAPKLQLTGRVVDSANLLDEATERSLTERLTKLETETTDQMIVVTVPSLEGQLIDKYSLDLANRWKIGRADVDNGVMLLVAPNEKKVRLEVGLGLGGLLTDERAATIVRSMLPHFRAGAYGAGIVEGVIEVDQILSSDRRRPVPKSIEMKKAA